MKLISDIINELIDSEKTISSPLLKTKVLASRLGNEELSAWVNLELNGYSNSEDVPEYRKYGCNVIGDYINGRMQYTKQPVPLAGLGESIEDMLSSVEFMQSIASLESLLKGNKKGTLELAFSAEMVGHIQENIIKQGNPYFQLINARKYISINAIIETLSAVRNRLLDFMLKVDNDFGNLTEIEELKHKQEEITHIMNQTIINATGDGNVVNTGDNSKIIAEITITKGNKEELKSKLGELGISQIDSDELISIIDDEIPTLENQKFNIHVNSWIQKMIGKSLDGSWQIGIATAGTVLAEIINKYYGI